MTTPTSGNPSCSFGLRDGLPLKQGQHDHLLLWLSLYPGDMTMHLQHLNEAGLRRDARFNPVSRHEYVRFWGMVIAARQYSEKGKDLWNNTSQGLREPPDFGRYMKEHRFANIRRLIPDMLPASVSDPWAKYRPMVAAYNANRHDMLWHDGDSTFDEFMSAYLPAP